MSVESNPLAVVIHAKTYWQNPLHSVLLQLNTVAHNEPCRLF